MSALRWHHLNCLTMRPLGGRFVVGAASQTLGYAMVCHCVLIETPSSGLVLIDTAIGLADVANNAAGLGRAFTAVTRTELDAAQTARRQIEALGFAAEDVRHIILTHMDLDHAGGLSDFPHATVHLYRRELEAALRPMGRMERERYKDYQWAHGPIWRAYDEQGERWFGFDAVRDLDGLPPELLLVPLTGHSRGHAGVAWDTGDGWMLHCGDAYFHRDEMRPQGHRCPAGLRLFQSVVQVDRGARLSNQGRLRGLVGDPTADVTVFSAHDATEWERLAGRA